MLSSYQIRKQLCEAASMILRRDELVYQVKQLTNSTGTFTLKLFTPNNGGGSVLPNYRAPTAPSTVPTAKSDKKAPTSSTAKNDNAAPTSPPTQLGY